MRSVSELLQEEHSISIRPGHKGECPACHHAHFSVKGDDSLGKCFYPACGHYLTRETASDGYGLAQALKALYVDSHAELLALATGQRNAYTYLRDERGVHPQVIADAMVGVVPSGVNVAPYFLPSLDAAQAALDTLKASGKKGAKHTQAVTRAETRLADLQTAQQSLHDCLAHHAGWLIFFYTDSAHRLVALRIREPYAKRFASFKPHSAGVFGRELFTLPSVADPAMQAVYDLLLITEGEFNTLTLQSLLLRYAETIGQPQNYLNACSVGGVSVADVETIKRCTQQPVVWYDHDASEAGKELVTRLQKAMPLEACTADTCPSDLDSFIHDFLPDTPAAWAAVKAVVATRKPYGRLYSGTGEEFFDTTITSPRRPVFIPKLLGDVLRAREHYRHEAALLWVYQGGVYRPHGEAVLEADSQALLGPGRTHHYIAEALDYVRVAVQTLDPDPVPDRQYLNVQNGRLDWALGQLVPHTPTVFSTAQLPIMYDPTAFSPTFTRYLQTTFDADVHPLIEEVLGWCLVPDRRFEKAVMLTGESGENGKSVLLDLIGALLGEENVSHVALQDLEENRFRVAELYGKLANVFADLDTRSMQSSSMFKTLTTGDVITAERKHQHPFTFRNYAKLIFSANVIPRSADRTPAFYRRWIIIPFTRTFNGQGGNPTPDKGLREKLQAELPGILNRALAGLARLQAQEAFTEPASVVTAKAAYMRSNDTVAAFLAECVEGDANGSVEKQFFYAVYGQWCQASGERPVSQKALKTTLAAHIPNLDEWRDPANGKWKWLGVQWNADASAYFPSKTFPSRVI